MAGGVNVSLTANVQQFQQQMRQAEQALGTFEKKGNEVAGRYVDAAGRMREANGRFVVGAGKAAESMDGLAKSASNLDDMIIPMAGAFAALTLGMGVATKAFSNFESVLNQTKAVSGATAAEMAILKEQALQLGGATVFSAKEAAQAQAELSKSGMNVNQVLAATPGVLALAASGQLEVARAAEITGSVLNSFGIEAERAGLVADMLSKAANASALSVEDVGESIKYAGSVAGATSQSLEDVSTFLAVLGNAGIKSSQAGTVFRAAIAGLAKPSDDAAQKLHDLKISIQDTGGKMLPLVDIIGQIRKNTAGMTEVQRANAVALIFGQEAMSGILALMKQTPAEVDKVAQSFRNVTDQAKETADIMNSGLPGALEQASGSVDTAVTLFGESLAPAIIAVAKGVESLADAYSKLDPSTKSLIAGAALAAAAFTGIAATVGPLVLGFGAIGGAAGVAALALNPITLTIGALAAAVGVATVALNNQATASNQTTGSLKAQGDKVNGLVAEYDKLQGKTKLTADEQARHKAILDELQKLAPDVIGSYDGMGNATGINRDRLFDMNNELRTQIELLNQAQKAAKEKSLADRDAARFSLYAAEQDVAKKQGEIKAALSGALGQGRGGLERVKALQAELRVLEDIRTSRARYAQQAANAFETSFPARATGKPTTTTTITPRTPGGIVNAPAGKGGKTDAQKEAEEIAKAAEEIAMAYREAAVEKTIAMGTASGAVIDFVRKEEAEELAAATEIAKGYGAAQDEKVAAMLAANNLIERAGWELANSLDDATQQGIREMQGALTALAIDPSLERVANFAEDLAADKTKMAEWGKTVEGVAKAFKDAGGGADGFVSALKMVGSAVDPITLAVAAAVAVVKGLADAFADAAKKQDFLRESVLSTASAIRTAQAELSGDPRQVAEANRKKAQEDLNKRLLEGVQGRKEAMMSGPEWASSNIVSPDLLAKNPGLKATVGTRISDLTIDNFTDLKDQQVAELGLFDKQFQDAIDGASKAADKAGDALKPMTDGIKEAFDEAAGAAEEAAQRIVDLNDEIERGGRDSWGNRISLEAEDLLKIQEANAAYDEKRAAALKRQRDLTKEIAQINQEEREAIAGIENEGIAVRAKTEFQDKTERIAKVRAEAQAKRDAKTEEINAIEAQMNKEDEARDKAVSNIRIIGKERIDALRLEAEQLQKVIDKANSLAKAYAKARESGGGSASNASNNTNGASQGDTSGAQYDSSGRKVWYTKGGVNYYHPAATGGMVAGGIPGKDSVPVMAMPGEVIVSEPVTRGIAAMVNAFQRGTLGMPRGMNMPAGQMQASQTQVVSIGDIHVHAAPGMSERDVAAMVPRAIAGYLHRTGIGRR